MQAAFAAGRRHFAYAALFSALLNLLFIAPMLYMLQVYDRVVPTQGRMTLLFLTLVLVLALATLAALEPEIALSFHGRPMQGAGMRAALHRLATGFRDIAVPREGRYLDDPRRAEDGSAYEKP